jgi:CheY-like chemotaxis protein
MWVESKPEEGSTFYFTLPWRTTYTEENSTRKTKKEEEKQLPGDIALLVVEDDETSYMLLREITDGSGINLLRAKNGKEAIEKVQDYPLINLILMDIKMPVMDGYETTREIKKIRPDIPVIAQTAYVSEKDREKAEKAGCDAYLSKPIDADKLMARIREAISE